MGIRQVARAGLERWERGAGYIFALGLVLTGLGSAWYHLAPGNATLVWDRLPLSTLFPVVFGVAIGDRVSVAAGRALLAPRALGAIASVLWWQQTDDLRAYVLAQFLPMVLIPLMLVLLPGHRPVAPLITGIALYAVPSWQNWRPCAVRARRPRQRPHAQAPAVCRRRRLHRPLAGPSARLTSMLPDTLNVLVTMPFDEAKLDRLGRCRRGSL